MNTYFVITEDFREYIDDFRKMELFISAQESLLNAEARCGVRNGITIADIYGIFGAPFIPKTEDKLCDFVFNGKDSCLRFNVFNAGRYLGILVTVDKEVE